MSGASNANDNSSSNNSSHNNIHLYYDKDNARKIIAIKTTVLEY
jgi:hypothetical protein